MPRVLGVDIPAPKPIFISLTYLYGVGRQKSIEICFQLGLDPQAKAGSLTEEDIGRINNLLDKEYKVEGQLRREVQDSIKRLRDIQCYRGMRHRRSLPVRGQRTRTNARTRKGVKKTVAGKKGVKDMKH
jgi:small subunit ribosomal protein S13